MNSIDQLQAELQKAREEIKTLEADKIAAESCVHDLMEALLSD